MAQDDLTHSGALRKLSSYLSELDIEIAADIDTQNEDGLSIDGYVINPQGLEIEIVTQSSSDWFEFSHSFDIRGMFLQSKRLEEINQERNYQSEKELRQTIESDEIFNLKEVTHEDFLSRARPVWDSLDDSDGLRYNILARLSVDTNDFQLFTTDDLVYGFMILRRLFYNDRFSMQTLDDEIQKTANFATPPRRLLTEAYGVFDESSRDGEIMASGLEPSDDPTYM